FPLRASLAPRFYVLRLQNRHAETSRRTVGHGHARRRRVTVLLDAFLVSSLSAQSGSVLAAVPGSARAAGMGGAGAAIVGDAGAAALGQSYTSADLLGVSSLVFRTGLAAIGTSVKYVRETVAGARADAWAGDVGLAIAVFDLMALGASVQNIGGDLGGGSHLPRRTRAGFTMNYVDPQGSYRLLTTVEGQWPSRATGGGTPFLVLGVE